MKPVMQTKFGDNGNCWAACLASLLEFDITDVPDLFTHAEDIEWKANTNAWLARYGFGCLEFSSLSPDDYKALNLATYHIIIGPSPRQEGSHAVIGRAGRIVHDPHPDGTGLLNGAWLHTVLIKLCD